MELHQGQFESNWSQYFCHQPPVEFDTGSKLHLLCDELKNSSLEEEENSDPYSGIWMNPERAKVKTCSTQSYAMDARIRLDNLKAGCKSSQPFRAVNGMLCNYNCEKDLEKKDEPEPQESALDLVEILDVEQDGKTEESWLYESPKKQVFEDQAESALTWCRQVLDNPSPEVEAACRQLIHRLDERSGSNSHRRPAVFQHAADVSVDLSLDKTLDGSNINNLSLSEDFTTTSYRLHNITDVRTMARLQEASLRQDFISTPASASPKRDHESPVMFPSYSDNPLENTDDFTPGCGSTSCQSPASEAKQGCQTPRLARLQDQVTQFKLLKLAQNQGTSAGRSRSPLQTSLRSLQAVRNSRSLDIESPPVDQITHPPSGASLITKGSSFWSPSLSRASTKSSGSVQSGGDLSARIKKLQRSQSASPCRIPHAAKGYLSFRGRVFASPERSASLAWGRNVPSTRR
ncbi:SLAIN motif-containing protein-like [Notolabrus celidotus]|uniref:SLAIN motif-containing protein-like n=1 Tax=Notolabrus celidotus TaxID=1203425 RepID=UPI00148FA3CB|nr:SLAIN motif-containing protein-like [Notolabrus celidotus]